MFGITDITKLIFESGDKTPAWTLMNVLSGAVMRMGDTRSDPCSYIGHGSIDPAMDTLRLESSKSNIQWKPLQDDSPEVLSDNLDQNILFL